MSLAREVGRPVSHLALAWCLRLPNVTSVITGATRPEQVAENVGAVGFELDPEVLSRIERILDNAPAPKED